MIGEKIKELRIKHQLTQSQLAQLAKLSPSAIGMYEHNRREPDSKTLLKFSGIFQVHVSYFYNDYDISPTKDNGPKDLKQFLFEIRKTFLTCGPIIVDDQVLDEKEILNIFDNIEKEIYLSVKNRKESSF